LIDHAITEKAMPVIKSACQFASLVSEDFTTTYGTPCFIRSLRIAEILQNIKMDSESIAAGIIYSVAEYVDLDIEDIKEQFGENIAQLINGSLKMSMINMLSTHNKQQINNIRKMLLAMVRDVRVVVIKLAERLAMMRSIRNLKDEKQKQFLSHETMEIYAPLANRLGLHQIKWELEDIAFFYLEQTAYKEIAAKLDERRIDRDKRINEIVNTLKKLLAKLNIEAEVYGRSKHIYSIKRKMTKKNVDFAQIYDINAIRIIVPTIEDCYTVLSLGNERWQLIAEEFDDYIANPKPNGYQSIHTALLDQNNKPFEIQIRTQKMHEDSEMGVAAHWKYKEGKLQEKSYEEKITWLRQLLDWQKELMHDIELPQVLEKNIFEDRVYVFTPDGDIIDLIMGSTPLDFAYHVHTEVGHRCRGAKVDGKIVPLNYQLKTGDRVEVLTSNKGSPSRDWIVSGRGYLKTSGARAKVLQWFKHQDHDRLLQEGKTILEQELQRLGLRNIRLDSIINKFNAKTVDELHLALGNGNTRITQVINAIQAQTEILNTKQSAKPTIVLKEAKANDKNHVTISGIDDLLSKIAKCCKPVPGDQIIGYITQSQGISIHHKKCKNIVYAFEHNPERLIDVEWNEVNKKVYGADVQIVAFDRPNLIRDITNTLANDKINMTHILTELNKKAHLAKFKITIEIESLEQLSKILDHIHQIPNIRSVERIS
jgi:GTP pyrophosphokinase